MALLPSAGSTDPSANNGGTSGSKSISDTLLNLVDPSGIRKQLAGLSEGGIAGLFKKKAAPGVNINNSRGQTGASGLNDEWRVRVGLLNWNTFPNNPMFTSLLSKTNGVIFPYTPSVAVTNNARYQEQALTHSNYKNYFYEGSDVASINISGDFTVQNHDDAMYLLAAIYFFKTCTKMFFGNDPLAGNPPPIVTLNGYGDFYFPNVTCVVTSFTHTLPPDVDYMEFYYTDDASSNGSISTKSKQIARLPTVSQLSVTLQPVYSRKNVHDNMTLGNFSQGKLLKGKGGFI